MIKWTTNFMDQVEALRIKKSILKRVRVR